MELWIRSQDKTNLILAKDIVVSDGNIKVYKETELCTTVAKYKSKERALEVLDEISSKIKNRYIVKPSAPIISTKDISNEKTRLNYLYSGEFIMENPPFEIKPINSNIIYYEMPEE